MIPRLFLITGLLIGIATHPLHADERITIVFTGNSNGKLESCDCSNDPYGGLAERVTLIRELRKEESPFILLDGGRMVSLYGDFQSRAGVIMDIMNLMAYDAAGLENSELFYGLAGIRPAQRKALFPLVSASIDSGGKPAFALSLVKIIGGVSCGIISITDSTGFKRMGQTKGSDFTLIPPEKALERGLKSISAIPDFIVVLSTLEPDRNEAMLKEFPSIDLIIEVNGNQTYDAPKVSSGRFIVSPGFGGEFVGLITLVRSSSRKLSIERYALLPVLDMPADSGAAALVRKYSLNTH